MLPKSRRGVLSHHTSQKVGESVQGASLELFGSLDSKSDYLVMAGHHGTEPETTLLLSYVLRSILPEQLACPVLLAANPDGLSRGTRGNARGVDLNRNFPTEDWSPEVVKHRWNDNEESEVELSPGTEPASEPETITVLKLIEQIQPKTIVTLHAPLACIDDPDNTPIAQKLAEVSGFPLVDDIGYPVPGSFGTWGLENGIPVVTVELGYESIVEHRQRFEETLRDLLVGVH